MLKAGIETEPASRIVLLKAALERARSENGRICQRDADLRAELERVYAENRRLRAAVLDVRQPAGAAQPRFLGGHEMTAGTRRSPSVAVNSNPASLTKRCSSKRTAI